MYINDVVRHVMNVYPSEYDAGEMYKWCDEVSSMLITEDRNVYKRVVLPVSSDGTILLPEGVTQEYVDKITAGNDILNYTDYRTYGDKDIYIKGRNGIRLDNTGVLPKSVTVDYREKYREIRMITYNGKIQTNEASFWIEPSDFVEGDILNITITDGDDTETYTEVPVFSSDILYIPHLQIGVLSTVPVIFDSGDTVTVCGVPQNTFGERENTETQTAVIKRCITEKTVCDAPFDQMYVEFVLAKIRLYQNDTQGYNTYMTMFNSHLSAYRDWLIKRMPSGDNRIRNWW